MVTRRQGILGSLGAAILPETRAHAARGSLTAHSGQNLGVPNRAVLASLQASKGDVVHLLEEGRDGLFRWDTGDLSKAAARDPRQGLLVAPASDPAGTSGAWVRQYSGPAIVTWFGAIGDGKADDAPALQAAINSGAAQIAVPQGDYRTSSPIAVDGNISLRGEGGSFNRAAIRPDKDVLEAIQFGKKRMFSGVFDNLLVGRGAYDGSTQNIGFALYDVANATFSDCDSRLFKFPWRFKPASGQRVAYTAFLNIQATFGFHNISVDLSAGDGYVNELVFVGGRCSASPDTVSNVHIDQDCNHWRFAAMSLEGTGSQAAFVSGTSADGTHSIVFDQCRTEGKWANDHIVLEKGTTLLCEVRGWNLYTTVTFDLGDNHLIQTASQNVVSIGTNQVSALKLHRNRLATGTPLLDLEDEYASSGTSFGLRYTAKRGAGTLLQFLRGKTQVAAWTLLGRSQALLTNLGRAVFRRTSQDRARAVLSVQDEYARSGRANLMEMRSGRANGRAIGFANAASDTDQGAIEIVNDAVKFRSAASGHDTAPLQLGDHYLWVDGSGNLRIKEGAPASDRDGRRVGSGD